MITFKALDKAEEWNFIRDRAHVLVCEDSIGVVAGDERGIAAVCVADCFTKEGCQINMAIERPIAIKHGFFNEVFRHLFIACGLKRIFCTVRSDNKKALKLNKHLGFYEANTIKDYYSEGIDCVIMRIDKEYCRWINQMKEAA